MKKQSEPLAMIFAVTTLLSLKLLIKKMVKKYSGVKL